MKTLSIRLGGSWTTGDWGVVVKNTVTPQVVACEQAHLFLSVSHVIPSYAIMSPCVAFCHRVETYRDVTSVPTFFVRMLGKLLDACI